MCCSARSWQEGFKVECMLYTCHHFKSWWQSVVIADKGKGEEIPLKTSSNEMGR
jgi:hypothetical protein